MHVALIPPRGLENYALRSNFHLTLAIPGLQSRKTYGGMYQRAVRLGDYVVLDNGAAEGQPATDEALFNMGKALQCNEVVLPDSMYESKQTVEAVARFLSNPNFVWDVVPKMMAVPQGTALRSFRYCINAFAEMPDIKVIGIPRHIIPTLDMKSARVDLANWIAENHPNRFEIHFLGMHPMWLGEIPATVKYAPHVRSVDSSLPFNYAIARKRLVGAKDIVMRPDFYFEEDWSRRISTKLVRDNIKTLMEWANAEYREEAPSSPMRVVPAL